MLLNFVCVLLALINVVQCNQDNAFIVTFTEYLSLLEQREVLAQCLQEHPKWFTEQSTKLNRSDFCVIRGTENTGKVKSDVLRHSKVSGIYPDKHVSVQIAESKDTDSSSSSYLDFFQRKIMSVTSRSITSLAQAPILWRRGIRGNGVKVAILDTGLQANHPHFLNIKDAVDFTDENDPSDRVIGHGTFVAGVIASSRDCLGIAPATELYSLKVFNSKQASHTSWFLEAFNYALQMEVDILNLSIGGPDFNDKLFVNKVKELTAKGIIFVSALGNDGPLYGTLNNPADQLDVIGVGGLNYEDEIADFSSRGMTLWEIPYGYGRVKPDIVTYGTAIRGSSLRGTCRYLTGTSVSSPVVAGIITLLVEVMNKNERLSRIRSPASIKQVLMASAERVQGANMFEQGSGKINLMKAYELVKGYIPQITVSPNKIDWTDCPYMWPYCSQPLYYTAMPQIINMTIINGMNVKGKIVDPPTWHPKLSDHILDVSFSYNPVLHSWTGYVAIFISVNDRGKEFAGTVEGYILVTVKSPPSNEDISDQESTVKINVKVNVIPTPARHKRILWDQFHSLGYPLGPFPRDNLNLNTAPLDWNGDHIHTNFNELYKFLRTKGYFIEVLTHPFTCFDSDYYGHLLLVDPEDDFFPEEISKLEQDVNKNGLNLMVFADWYNSQVIKHLKFFDDNTKQWVILQGGGSNIPALNKLLSSWNIVLSDKIWKGKFTVASRVVEVVSSSSILSFHENGQVLTATLTDEASDVLNSNKVTINNVPILGIVKPINGSVAVFGDSSCIDTAGYSVKCYWLVEELLSIAITGNDKVLPLEKFKPINFRYPKLASTPLFHRYSRVVKNANGIMDFQPIPACPVYSPVESKDYNDSYPIGQLHSKLLAINAAKNDIIDFDDYAVTNDDSARLFKMFFVIVTMITIAAIYFLYTVYCLFHRKRIVFYKIKTRGGV